MLSGSVHYKLSNKEESFFKEISKQYKCEIIRTITPLNNKTKKKNYFIIFKYIPCDIQETDSLRNYTRFLTKKILNEKVMPPKFKYNELIFVLRCQLKDSSERYKYFSYNVDSLLKTTR